MKIIGLLLLLTQAFASWHEFALVYEAPLELDNLTAQKNRSFLKELESQIPPPIKFGTDRGISIQLSPWSDEEISCQNMNQQITVEGGSIIFSGALQRNIAQYSIYQQINDCSLYERFKSLFIAKILTLPNVVNLERWPRSERERETLRECKRQIRRERSLSIKRQIRNSEQCRNVLSFERRQRLMNRYERRFRRLTRNIEMDIDLSSLTDTDLNRYDICSYDYSPTTTTPNGTRYKMLGYGIVYFAPGYTTSMFGHVGERIIYCRNNQIVDELYEYSPMRDLNIDRTTLVDNHQDPESLAGDTEYLQSLVGKNIIKIMDNPTGGYETIRNSYGKYQYLANRDMIELWPDINEDEILRIRRNIRQHWNEQEQKLSNREPLEDYDLLRNNCTHRILERLETLSHGDFRVSQLRGFNPVWLFHILKNRNLAQLTLYPSQHLMRRLELLEADQALFWENTTLFASTSQRAENTSEFVMFYPEYTGVLSQALMSPLLGGVNLIGAIIETLYGVIQIPYQLIQNRPLRRLRSGTRNMFMSFGEILGVRQRFPKPTEWTDEEYNIIHEDYSNRTPSIIPMLMRNVSL